MNEKQPATLAELQRIATSDHDCPGIHAAEDAPYAFSGGCTWHGDLRTAGTRRVTRKGERVTEPACPHCGAGVIEAFSEQAWWFSARRNNARIPEYEAMMRWSQGKCFPDFDTLQNAYRQAMEGQN